MNRTKNSQQNFLQLEQKLIHYKSEIAKYKAQLEKLNSKLQLQKEQTDYYKAVIRASEQYRIAKEEYEKERLHLELHAAHYEARWKEAETKWIEANRQFSLLAGERDELLLLMQTAVTNLLKEKKLMEKKIEKLYSTLEEQKRDSAQLKDKLGREETRFRLLTAERDELLEVCQYLVKIELDLKNELDQLQNAETDHAPDSAGNPVRAMFIHSVILPDSAEEPVAILGHATVENMTNQPLHHPVLCLKIQPHQQAQLTGKIVSPPKMDGGDVPFQDGRSLVWTYAHPNFRKQMKENGEYWLKPVEREMIAPYGKISFDQFQITFPENDMQEALIVKAFFYCEEHKNGIPFENQIIIS